jgi:ABC-2 type transport system ATP-binding protein
MSTTVITARNLVKRYNRHTAVNGIDFDVFKGEVFGLLGPNGAGKTTTVLMMLGLTDITDGRLDILGLDPRRQALAVKEKIGYMPDSVGFYDNMTARENLVYTARLLGLNANQRKARIEQALARVRLLDRADDRVSTFSHGMKRRLGLAEIVLKQAEIAILDEPTSGLDPQSTEDFLQLIESLKADGVTIILSSHLLNQVQRICDRVALFHAGRIGLMGTLEELAQQIVPRGLPADMELDALYRRYFEQEAQA